MHLALMSIVAFPQLPCSYLFCLALNLGAHGLSLFPCPSLWRRNYHPFGVISSHRNALGPYGPSGLFNDGVKNHLEITPI